MGILEKYTDPVLNPYLTIPTMAYSIHSHISYILEANSKKPIREKKEEK